MDIMMMMHDGIMEIYVYKQNKILVRTYNYTYIHIPLLLQSYYLISAESESGCPSGG